MMKIASALMARAPQAVSGPFMIENSDPLTTTGAEGFAAPAEARASSARRTSRQLTILVFMLVLCAASYFLISRYVLMSVQISGISMSPTLFNGERYILLRFPYLWRNPRQGEIVVIRDPEDHGLSIKRIIARPNDVIEIRRDGVYINHAKLAEPYLASFASFATCAVPVRPTRLGPDDYFVLGDNRGFSADSRSYGPVPRKDILGLISKSE
jgi:signal peptidase I